MVSCCVCGTTAKRSDKNITFHLFPKDPVRRNKWIVFANKGDWKPRLRSVLCSKHFDQDCFDRTSTSVVRLKPQAIPTLIVERQKYVRNHNPEFVIPISSDSNTSQLPESKSVESFCESSPSISQVTPKEVVLRSELTEITPIENGMQRKICYVLGSQDLRVKKLDTLQRGKLMLIKKIVKDKTIPPKGVLKVMPMSLQDCIEVAAPLNNVEMKDAAEETADPSGKMTYLKNNHYVPIDVQGRQSSEIQGFKRKCEALETENKCLNERLDALETIIKSKDAALQNTRTLVACLKKESAQKEEILQKLTEILSNVFSETELQILNCKDMDQQTKLRQISSVS